MHFFVEKFGHVKKKQYLCTRFRKGSDFEIQIGAVVQLVRIHACHAWGREFESRPHRKRSNLRVAFFCVLWLFTRLQGLIFNIQNSARARNNNIIITEKSFRYVIVILRWRWLNVTFILRICYVYPTYIYRKWYVIGKRLLNKKGDEEVKRKWNWKK